MWSLGLLSRPFHVPQSEKSLIAALGVTRATMVYQDVWHRLTHPFLVPVPVNLYSTLWTEDEQLLLYECTFQIHFIFVNAVLILNHNEEMLSGPKRNRGKTKKKTKKKVQLVRRLYLIKWFICCGFIFLFLAWNSESIWELLITAQIICMVLNGFM